MAVLPHILIVASAVVAFALLLRRADAWRAPIRTNSTTTIAIASLASINMAGAFGLVWFAAILLTYDGLMIVELGICVGVMAALAIITTGGFALSRRGRELAAVALLALAAVPTLLAYALLIYLDAHPIDMR